MFFIFYFFFIIRSCGGGWILYTSLPPGGAPPFPSARHPHHPVGDRPAIPGVERRRQNVPPSDLRRATENLHLLRKLKPLAPLRYEKAIFFKNKMCF